MTVERSLSKLLPAKQREAQEVQRPTPGVQVSSRQSVAGRSNDAELRREARLLRSSGDASLETGNSWHGLPQRHMELRAVRETVIDLGQVSGEVVIDLSLANVFAMQTVGETTINLNLDSYPQIVMPGVPNTFEFSVTLHLFKADAAACLLPANVWAPNYTALTLMKEGYHQVTLSVTVLNAFTWIVAYPTVLPA